MSLDFARKINFNIRKKLFRREVETSFYSNKNFSLPRMAAVKGEEVNQFKANYPFRFISSPEERNSASAEIQRFEKKESIISYADTYVNNNILLYGNEINCHGKINWSKDYISGYEWGNELTWKKDFFSFSKGTDIKNAWEQGRLNQCIFLGKAYLLTGDEKYALKYKEIFTSFMEMNPFCASVQWVDSSEAAIRLVNLVFSLAFFLHSPSVDEKFINDFRNSILLHSVFIENNLDYKMRRGSSYLLDLLGLAATAVLFTDNYYGKRLFAFSYNNLEQEIRSQIHRDGVSYEQSLPYHALSLEAFYLAKIILEKNGPVFSEGYNELLYKMFDAHFNYLREDHSVPQVGDSISGRILPFNINDVALDFSYPMPVGAYLFKENKFKLYSQNGSPELFFLFGPSYCEKYKALGKSSSYYDSIGLTEGGHYIIRTPEMHLFVEAGEIGNRGEGAPGHNDIFSFELFYKNNQFIVDPGTYSFYADSDIRNRLRSVRVHNSISIDNELLAKFDGVFKIKEDLTKPKILEWKSDNEEDILSIQHYAYTRFIDPVICKRTFKFMKYKNFLKIKDEMFGGAEHTASANIVFHPGVHLESIDENFYKASANGEAMEIRLSSPSDQFFTSVQDCEYSSRYGNLGKTKKLNIYLKEKFPAFFITEITLL